MATSKLSLTLQDDTVVSESYDSNHGLTNMDTGAYGAMQVSAALLCGQYRQYPCTYGALRADQSTNFSLPLTPGAFSSQTPVIC